MAPPKNDIDKELEELLDISEKEILKAIESAKKLVSFDGHSALKELMQEHAKKNLSSDHESDAAELLEITTNDVEEVYVKEDALSSSQQQSTFTKKPPREREVDPSEISGVFNALQNENPESQLVDQTIADETQDDSDGQQHEESSAMSLFHSDDINPSEPNTDIPIDVEDDMPIDDDELEQFSDIEEFDDVGSSGMGELLTEDDIVELEEDIFIDDETPQPPPLKVFTPPPRPLPRELGMDALDAHEMTNHGVYDLTQDQSANDDIDDLLDVPDDDIDIDFD